MVVGKSARDVVGQLVRRPVCSRALHCARARQPGPTRFVVGEVVSLVSRNHLRGCSCLCGRNSRSLAVGCIHVRIQDKVEYAM